MIEIEDLLELELLLRKVSLEEYREALIKVLRNPKLPPRGQGGDSVNVQRVELVLVWLLDELREILARKSR